MTSDILALSKANPRTVPVSADDNARVSELLSLREFRERLPRYSVEVYEQMPERNENGKRTELIRGIILERTSNTPLHSYIIKRLYDRVWQLAPQGWTVRQNDPLRFIDSMPEPDVSVVRGNTQDYWDKHPNTADLVIEIGISSLPFDRANAGLYAENGVREYWIVVATKKSVEVFLDPQEGAYRQSRIYSAGQTLKCESIPPITLNLHELFTL